MMVQNDRNEVVRQVKGEEHKIRREALAFAREKHECDVIERALKALPELMALAQVRKDPHAKRYAENAYWNRTREAIFGYAIEVQPESAEEEAQMLAAKKEREPQQTGMPASKPLRCNRWPATQP